MKRDALSIALVRYAAWAMAIIFGSASIFMLWASLYYPPAAERALIYFVLATGIELVRPKN
jgi:hypothetical protein